ncbi:hypothetical protein IJ541_02160 [bacterium]|nr:hypothetical protein [bacterium]
MKVVILGKGLMLANLILGAIDAGAEIAGVFRYESTCTNPIKLFFDDTFRPKPEVTIIKQFKLNQIRLKSANSEAFRKILINQNIDLVLVGTWREKLKKETFDIPKIGTVNVHPSLLPKYRGPNPYIQTILHGEEYSGVTLHLVDERFDSGAILSQKRIKILETDTSKELREKSARIARTLVCNFINDLNEKIITPIKQVEKNASYYPNITGEEMMLDFKFQTSDEISRTVRALHPFLPCYITYENRYFSVNPYAIEILDSDTGTANPNTIIGKDAQKRSITIVCKDKKAIKFSDLKLYKAESKTENFIKNEVIQLKDINVEVL